LVYRAFTRIGDEKVPDAKTLARLGQAIGPDVIGKLHGRLMELARERGVVQGRKMRVDTTVVETNIHYPTDSSLLGGWCARADADDEEGREGNRRTEKAHS
jgi:IS5 family transposase